jgi:hypothetical protein
LLSLLLAAALVLSPTMAFAQDGGGGNPIMPKFSIGGEQKRKLTPEEQERQKQIDADYKAATSKIPTQKTVDPWGDVRQAPPAASAHKPSASSQNASTQKRKAPAPQAQ